MFRRPWWLFGFLSACDDPADSNPTYGGTLIRGGVVECANPENRSSLGPVESTDWGEDWAVQPGTHQDDAGGGLVVADWNADGAMDIFLPSFGRCVLFMGVDGRSFSDETEWRLPDVEICHSIGASTADVEGDGDLDLFVAVVDGRNLLYLNDGTGHFSDGTEEWGLLDEALPSMGASWADMDGDGDLDLFVANHSSKIDETYRPPFPGAENRLYLNEGHRFVDVSERLGTEDRTGYTFVGSWSDVDLDGDPDLQLINDFGARTVPNRLLLNDGSGRFTLVEDTGLDLAGDAMGIGMGDLNDDGRPDYVISDWDRMHLRVSHGHLSWVEEAIGRGFVVDHPDRVVGWGTQMADVDNDADLDIWMGFGHIVLRDGVDNENPELQPDGLWLRGVSGEFDEVAAEWGVDDSLSTRGGLWVDLDGNGSLDLIRRELRAGPAVAWRTRCSEAAWIGVSLEGVSPNPFGIGAEIQIESEGRVQRRWIEAGSTSVMSSGPPVAHFGLGSAEEIDVLRVLWPDGRRSEFPRILPRQQLHVVHPELTMETGS